MPAAPGERPILRRYERELARCAFSRDSAQLAAVHELDRLAAELAVAPRRSWLGRLGQRLSWRESHCTPVRGLYLWGGVGRGKTWLMDLFFDALPHRAKLRRHFHRFMRGVHEELAALAGQQDPLEAVAERLARRARVLCFDELFVSDITDAMLLGTLLDALFKRGTTLVATSNVRPQELYRDGLQRARFLPAIALIEQHTTVMHLDSGIDYRLRLLERAEIYHSPPGGEADENLHRWFAELAPESTAAERDIEILGRRIPTQRLADGVVWFGFDAICASARSPNDYIEIAREFHTVMISDIPQLTADIDDAARRFIALVDEFYDRNVKLIVSAAAPLERLYAGDRLAFEFERTRSRLVEMQSHDYLAAPHLP